MNLPAAATLCGLLACAAGAFAADEPRLRETRLETRVQPAFRIAPLVRRYEAPRGKLLTFEFEVESPGKPTSLRVRPVGLRQEENGVIMPDEGAVPPAELRLDTPPALELKSGERATIRGTLRVPRTDSNFHSFGVLVQDLGSPVERPRVDGVQESKSAVGIRFVTQCLLRCDVMVTNGRAAHVGKLEVPAAELRERGGRPQIRAWVINPTDSPIEFGARALLVSPRHHSSRRPLPLVLPARAALEGPEREVARILPGSRVRLEAVLEEAAFPGDYELHVELLDGHHAVQERTFPASVHSGEFPAQDVQIVQAAPGVSIEPGQIELSLGPGGRRYLAATLVNSGPGEVQVRFAPQTFAGDPCTWFLVRPGSLRLAPGQRRKVLVTVAPARDETQHHYGRLRVAISGAAAADGPAHLPVALLGHADNTPRFEVGKLRWDAADPPAFAIAISNRGPVHAPVTGTLTLTDAHGRRRELFAGYGRWLLPGRSADLRFEPERGLTAGTWELRAEITIGEAEPVRLREVIRIGHAE